MCRSNDIDGVNSILYPMGEKMAQKTVYTLRDALKEGSFKIYLSQLVPTPILKNFIPGSVRRKICDGNLIQEFYMKKTLVINFNGGV